MTVIYMIIGSIVAIAVAVLPKEQRHCLSIKSVILSLVATMVASLVAETTIITFTNKGVVPWVMVTELVVALLVLSRSEEWKKLLGRLAIVTTLILGCALVITRFGAPV